MQRVKLLKELPGHPVGHILYRVNDDFYAKRIGSFPYEYAYNGAYILENPDWFERLPEDTFTLEDMILFANYHKSSKEMDAGKYIDQWLTERGVNY